MKASGEEFFKYCEDCEAAYGGSRHQSTGRRTCKAFLQHLQKMKNQHKTIDQIYDLFAVRIWWIP